MIDDKSGPGGHWEIPGILTICDDREPLVGCPVDSYAARSTLAGLPGVLDIALLPCSLLPRPRRKQDPIVFALMVALPVVMFQILLQRSPQRRFSKQDQPRQTFFFDRPHPAFRVRVQIRAPCWQSKRIHTSRLDQFSK